MQTVRAQVAVYVLLASAQASYIAGQIYAETGDHAQP